MVCYVPLVAKMENVSSDLFIQVQYYVPCKTHENITLLSKINLQYWFSHSRFIHQDKLIFWASQTCAPRHSLANLTPTVSHASSASFLLWKASVATGPGHTAFALQRTADNYFCVSWNDYFILSLIPRALVINSMSITWHQWRGIFREVYHVRVTLNYISNRRRSSSPQYVINPAVLLNDDSWLEKSPLLCAACSRRWRAKPRSLYKSTKVDCLLW